MKKRIKSIALSTLFLFPMLLSGCENPFGASNSIGSSGGYNETVPSNPTPSGGGSSGGASNTEKEEDTPVQSTPLFYNPYDYEEGEDPTGSVELIDSIGYVKSIYKKGSSALDALEIPARIEAYKATASKILTRLGYEYGKPNEIEALHPLSDVGAQTFKKYGLMPNDYAPTSAELNAVTDAFLAAKYVATFKVAGSMEYALISTGEYGGDTTPLSISHNTTNGSVEIYLPSGNTIYKVFNTQGAGELTVGENNKLALSETDAFYKIVKSDGNIVYLIYKTDFVKNFGHNFLELIDTHRDAIRYNVVSFKGTPVDGKTLYSLTTKPWKICEGDTFSPGADYVGTFTSTYEDRVAIEIASVMAFGVNNDKTLNLPTSPVGDAFNGTIAEYYESAIAGSTTADNYLAFVLKYVDHNGYVPYEADAIAEYLTNSIVGGGANSVLALDETRYTQNAFINLDNMEKTFNSNEMMLDAGEKVGRQLIKNYTNTNSRAFEKNTVFKTITYNTSITDSAAEIKYTVEGNQNSDERSTLFKNYYNTFYSACYGIGLNDPNDISVLEINSDYSYLQNVIIVDSEETEEDTEDEDTGEEDTGDEDTGEETEGEDKESDVYDAEYAGKLQSIVIFPKEKINIRYIEICVLGVLGEGQKLDISADLRYCVGGQVYYVPNAFDAEGGSATIDSEEYMTSFEYKSGLEIGAGKEFKNSNNNLVKEKLLSFDNCVGNDIPELRKKGLFGNPTGPGKEISSASFGYNSNATTMGANYIYNELEYDFIEICFNVKTIYNNFDTNYSINAIVNSIYGTKV